MTPTPVGRSRPGLPPLIALLARAAVPAAVVLLAEPAVRPPPLEAQGIEDELVALAEGNAILYVEPLTRGLGVAINQGRYHTAAVHRLVGVHLGVGFTAGIAPDEDDFFRPVVPTSVAYEGLTYTEPYGDPSSVPLSPTATGEGAGVVLEPRGTFREAILAAGADPVDFALTLPEGFDIPAVPFVFIEGGVGLVLGTEATVRVIPATETSEEVGEVTAFGYGIKHSLSQYIPHSPIDVAVQYSAQDVEVGQYLDASGTAIGVIASKDFGPLTLFGGGSVESAEVDVGYAVDNPDGLPHLPAHRERIEFTTELDSETLFATGLTLNLAFLKVSGNYAFGERDAAAVKVLLSFR